jgi:hypothetical protein
VRRSLLYFDIGKRHNLELINIFEKDGKIIFWGGLTLAAENEGVRPVLLIEGSWRDIYGVNGDRIRSLQQHLNRLAVETIPVIYTESIDETFRYLNSVIHRVKEGEFGSLVDRKSVV